MTKPDFEKMVRSELRDKFGWTDPAIGRQVVRLMKESYSAGMERAAEIADALRSDPASADYVSLYEASIKLTAAIRVEKNEPTR